jgi:hypothetical protein
VETPGRNGPIELLVGVDNNGDVIRVVTLASSENAAGALIHDESFLERFVGVRSGIALGIGGVEKNQVAAVTSGTISSQAVVNGVNIALAVLEDVRNGIIHGDEYPPVEVVPEPTPTVEPTPPDDGIDSENNPDDSNDEGGDAT